MAAEAEPKVSAKAKAHEIALIIIWLCLWFSDAGNKNPASDKL